MPAAKPAQPFERSVWYLIHKYGKVALAATSDADAHQAALTYIRHWNTEGPFRIVRTDQYVVGEFDGESIQSTPSTKQCGISA